MDTPDEPEMTSGVEDDNSQMNLSFLLEKVEGCSVSHSRKLIFLYQMGINKHNLVYVESLISWRNFYWKS